MKTLVFAPHPDDEIIGCGGYLAKLTQRGDLVDVVYITAPYQKRKIETNKVKKLMGFNKIYFFDEKERTILPNRLLLKKILHIIRNVKPNQMIIPHINETDRDHKILSGILQESVCLSNSDFLLEKQDSPWKVDFVIGYEVWTPISSPQLFVNITNVIKTKEEAMKIYKSQLNQKDFISMFKGLNKFRSISAGCNGFSEAFEVYKLDETLL